MLAAGPGRGGSGVGKSVRQVRLPEDHGSSETSWLGREPQEGGEDMATGRAEGITRPTKMDSNLS